MNLNKGVLQDFYNLTRFDVSQLFIDVSFFLKNDYPDLVNYFSGNTALLAGEKFKKLNDLIDRTKGCLSTFTQNKISLNNLEFWDLLEQVEGIDSILLTALNTSKWLRSSKTNSSFSQSPETQVILGQDQSLEALNRDILNDNRYYDNWVNTAFRNDLNEEGYTNEGGNLLKVSFFTSSQNLNLKCVVDNIFGENVYGKDFDKKIQFEDDDLKTLVPIDTFKQTIFILLKLKKRDNPDYINQGVNPNFAIGTNINLVAYPSIFRQMSETFSRDDTIKSFTLKDIKRIQDGVYLQFEVESRLGDLQSLSIQLTN